MNGSPPNRSANGLPVTGGAGPDRLHHGSEDVREARENELPRYRVEVEGHDGGVRRVDHVRAGSMEQALAKVREADWWSSGGPGGFRVVEATEEDPSGEARHRRNARRRHLNTIVEAGLTALGENASAHPDHEFSDVLSDFFTRAVVLPGHFPFPGGNPEVDRLLDTDDVAAVLTRLLTTHLAHHGLEVARTRPE
ncbi:hypothetical protein FHX81_1679 [Saccharothrix saharensis]|uniref:Uncharacterized protein n=1 Tax=Saccharothrix saharensis TaxID=571190 RepID=A0A543J961_9PSEU|nr:hypothetical protein [Saccharothrix saharensis]TQM79373.1 hypothetical protein FHX81_1679 [Saccharothrix saharensis]